ncbi:hypothetical protein SDC9_152046 [bioreactor metagenome]|uniref:Uncharacterized protein n=1 Tax=bioreactor metagenome TaxID=1076179 RepID=A0A645ES05_9ZZZZ
MHEAACEGNEYCHAGGGGQEILYAKSEHLGQIAHRRLAAVRLPVRVGSKTGSGIEGQIGCRCHHAVRIERQHVLQALQRVYGQETNQVEDQDGQCIACPGHRVVATHSRQAIDASLQRAQPAYGERNVALIDARHVAAQRPGTGKENGQIQADLQIAVASHEKFSGKNRTAIR